MDPQRKLCLKTIGDTHFSFKRDFLSLVFWWQRDTEAANIVWVRVVVVGIHWPPVMHVNCFTDAPEILIKGGD